MELKEFVKKVLIDLDSAVSEARKETDRDIRFEDTKESRTVEFDIAVTVEEASSKGGGAGIKVLKFVEGKGEVSSAVKNATVSRIRFGVKIDALTRKEYNNSHSYDLNLEDNDIDPYASL